MSAFPRSNDVQALSLALAKDDFSAFRCIWAFCAESGAEWAQRASVAGVQLQPWQVLITAYDEPVAAFWQSLFGDKVATWVSPPGRDAFE